MVTYNVPNTTEGKVFDIYYKAFTWIYNATDKIYYQDDFTMGNGLVLFAQHLRGLWYQGLKEKITSRGDVTQSI